MTMTKKTQFLSVKKHVFLVMVIAFSPFMLPEG